MTEGFFFAFWITVLWKVFTHPLYWIWWQEPHLSEPTYRDPPAGPEWALVPYAKQKQTAARRESRAAAGHVRGDAGAAPGLRFVVREIKHSTPNHFSLTAVAPGITLRISASIFASSPSSKPSWCQVTFPAGSMTTFNGAPPIWNRSITLNSGSGIHG